MCTPEQALEAAVGHHRAGRLREAEEIYRQILAAEPREPDALHLLGVLAHQVGRHSQAVELLRAAIAVAPNCSPYHCNLGNALARLGDFDAAAAAYRKAVELDPRSADALSNLGNSLGILGKNDQSIACYRQAIALEPANARFYTNLADALRNQGHLDESVAACHKALELDNHLAAAYSNLGNALHDTGRTNEAIAAYESSLAIEPNPVVLSCLLFALHNHPGYDAPALLAHHRQWQTRYAAPFHACHRPHPNDPSPTRPLRIGYVSPDLREHPVARFLLPLLQHHDPQQFQAFCYTQVASPDAMSQRIRSLVQGWRCISGLSPLAAASAIRDDKIDVLIDLALHTRGDQLLVFACKPAPVQATYLAYCSTSGLSAMDYRLTDPYLDPVDSAREAYSEESVYLQSYWCYQPVAAAPSVAPPPARSNGYVTFGCLNGPAKLSVSVLHTWCRLLQVLPHTQLLLHAHPGQHRTHIAQLFAAAGIDEQRLHFVGKQPLLDYLETYHQIDVSLDPYPYNGGTTTCDSLWMGVPVISLAGSTAVSRAGSSLLSTVGLPELVARSEDGYISIAASLAANPQRLSDLRRGLRHRMQSSPLMDAVAFARDMEACYRAMWTRWCQSQ